MPELLLISSIYPSDLPRCEPMNDPQNQEPSARRFGRNVEAIRRARGASRQDLAEQLGYHVSYIGAIERGERNITLKTSDKLAQSLGVTVGDLLRR